MAELWRVLDLTIDEAGQRLCRGDQELVLPQLSFKFLMALVRAAPGVITHDELMQQVWAGIFVNSETVTQRAKLLRGALDEDPRTPRYFVARRGVGYQLLVRPSLVAESSPSRAQAYRQPRRLIAAATAALAVIALAGTGAVKLQPTRSPTVATPMPAKVAVLPFDNLSNNPADAYIARSIPEMVLNRLSSVGGLAVISRESSMLSIAASAAPRDAGIQLKAAYVVKGSIQRSGATLRVTCFVVDTASDTRLWSEYFDWPVNRIYALQDRIADHVAASLETRVHGLRMAGEQPAPSRNADAYLANLKGTSLLGRFTVGETDAAAAQFARAVQLDPDFAEAMVALYDARMQGADLRRDDLEPLRVRNRPLLDRALQLEPDSGPALFAKAMWSGGPAAERTDLFRRAAERDPSNSRGLTAYAMFLDTRSKPDTGAQDGVAPGNPDSSALLDRVMAIDPLSPRARFWAIQQHWTKATPEQIEQAQARELILDPQNYLIATQFAVRRWLVKGETADAIQRIEGAIAADPMNPVAANMAVAFYLDAKDPDAARAVARATPATQAADRVILSQYAGDVRGAGEAALGRGGHLFNVYQSWNWPQAVRDYALQSREYDRGAQAIATRFGFDLADPRTTGPAQAIAAPALAHILIVRGDRDRGTRLLTRTVEWIDAHPNFGFAVHMRIRATAMMLLGERSEALSNLRASVEAGHDIHHWWYVIDRDPVWQPARSDPRFQAIAELYRRAAAAQRVRLDTLRQQEKIPFRSDHIAT